jgi:hypothetical protein
MSKSRKAVHDFVVGKNYFIRCITHHYTGRLVGFTPRGDFVLVDAAWIADDGRFAQAMATGELSEVEPYPDGQEVFVNRETHADATEWKFPLPRKQK